MSRIRLIAGLGNPGRKFEGTPHNVGARWAQNLAARFSIPMSARARFRGSVGRGDVLGRDVWFLVPSTYMNLSGESVGALSRFYGIEPCEILVAHDEVDFPWAWRGSRTVDGTTRTTVWQAWLLVLATVPTSCGCVSGSVIPEGVA